MYGFLKNLRFFEPFFLLFLREKGLSFLEIGFLFSFREICINLMEIPSGALADLYGRKNAMLTSLGSYIVSFLLFGFSQNTWMLYLAMFFFAIGEAFRTGTHKAIIFDWLRHEKRESEKTKIYGYTRSWSQLGSALSVLLASGLVFYTGKYEYVFWFSVIPYFLGLWNMAMYPSWLNRKSSERLDVIKLFKHLRDSLGMSFKKRKLRNLLIQSTIFTGQYKAVKDYLQIIIKAQILFFPLVVVMSREKQTAILIGAVYFLLYVLNSFASKNAYRVANLLKGKQRTIMIVFILTVLVMGLSIAGLYKEIYFVPISGFVILYVLQNIFRPVLMSSFDDYAKSDQQATVLSIESQAVSLAVLVFAPLMGFVVDSFGLSAVFYVSIVALSLYVACALLFSRFRKQSLSM